jgi:uncharacterized spore protein YtfJ
MSNENFLEKLATQFSQSASVKNVYGEPVQAGDKTIIPVAQIIDKISTKAITRSW